jgi:hypothetical protein
VGLRDDDTGDDWQEGDRQTADDRAPARRRRCFQQARLPETVERHTDRALICIRAQLADDSGNRRLPVDAAEDGCRRPIQRVCLVRHAVIDDQLLADRLNDESITLGGRRVG